MAWTRWRNQFTAFIVERKFPGFSVGAGGVAVGPAGEVFAVEQILGIAAGLGRRAQAAHQGAGQVQLARHAHRLRTQGRIQIKNYFNGQGGTIRIAGGGPDSRPAPARPSATRASTAR